MLTLDNSLEKAEEICQKNKLDKFHSIVLYILRILNDGELLDIFVLYNTINITKFSYVFSKNLFQVSSVPYIKSNLSTLISKLINLFIKMLILKVNFYEQRMKE